jgi:hypothetical protein
MQILSGNAKELNDLIPKPTWSSTWDSPEAFGRHIASLDKKKAWSDAGWSGDKDFCGTEDMDEALRLSQNGWKEGVAGIERLRTKILAMNPTHPKIKKYSIAGSYPDVARAVSGNPMNMRTLDSAKSRRRPVITLLSNMSANCNVAKESITNRASVVAAIIDQIEAAGYACEVVAIAPTAGSTWDGKPGYSACTSVMVKRSNQAVDLGRLSFGMGHAAMFRRMVFADWGSSQPNAEGLGRGLGYGHNIKDEFVDELNFKNIYVLPSAEENSSKFQTEDIAAIDGLKLIVDSLKEQECPAFAGPLTPEVKTELNNDF